MSIIGQLRNVSAVLLVLVVARGAFFVDPRFTILLLPPFLAYYSTQHPGWFYELPIINLVSGLFDNITQQFGQTAARFCFVVAGLAAGGLLGDAFGALESGKLHALLGKITGAFSG